ncbi:MULTISPECIES: pyridoxal phosphate-dependent aminotransferase [Mesorhizobium]|uniref:pyridoxal phosphate-dependent aminotransferase n=1 Tax=Mesorhizobium TaxID=68287 RepID=UPI00177CB817|nr:MULTISPECIES: histidinol-phosphate transaminase [Mesorhizobium]
MQPTPLPSEPLSRSLVHDFPGGYWRYGVTDHVLLVNLYFPPHGFYTALGERLPELISCYPSPQPHLAEQLGSLISQDPLNLAVGNGVAELIHASIQALNWRLAVPTPTFNPYEQVVSPERLARFPLPAPDFELDVEKFAWHAIAHNADAVVVISPNNPTSRGVLRQELLHLTKILLARNIRIIVDESFVEFTPEGASGSIEDRIQEYPNLVIFKSLGKIFGVCGLRLGYMLASDQKLISAVRRNLPAWNVSTLGEFFLHALPSYQREAEESWTQVRRDRDQLYSELAKIPDMHVLRPDANFVFCRLPDDWPDGAALAEKLLAHHRVLIRHSGAKTLSKGTRYLRIAARTFDENRLLVERLQEVAET